MCVCVCVCEREREREREREGGSNREREKERDRVINNLVFYSSQPLRLYQGNETERGRNRKTETER